MNSNKEQQGHLKDAVEQVEEKEILEILYEIIAENSREIKLTKRSDFLEEPASLQEEEVEEKINELMDVKDYQDIIRIKGKKDDYLFSEEYIDKNYGEILIKLEDNDLLTLMVDTVRRESKIYPRPTDIRLFKKAPFNFTADTLEKVKGELQKHEEFQDIKEQKASNGAVYLYSDKFLQHKQAKSLTEWVEVLQRQMP
jgi:hypothetical protein